MGAMAASVAERLASRPQGDATAAAPAKAERLRETARQLEAVFVRQLYAAMRETIPEDGAMTAGAGGEVFQQLFDEAMADRTPSQWGDRGLAHAVARQFAQMDRTPAAPVSPTESPR